MNSSSKSSGEIVRLQDRRIRSLGLPVPLQRCSSRIRSESSILKTSRTDFIAVSPVVHHHGASEEDSLSITASVRTSSWRRILRDSEESLQLSGPLAPSTYSLRSGFSNDPTANERSSVAPLQPSGPLAPSTLSLRFGFSKNRAANDRTIKADDPSTTASDKVLELDDILLNRPCAIPSLTENTTAVEEETAEYDGVIADDGVSDVSSNSSSYSGSSRSSSSTISESSSSAPGASYDTPSEASPDSKAEAPSSRKYRGVADKKQMKTIQGTTKSSWDFIKIVSSWIPRFTNDDDIPYDEQSAASESSMSSIPQFIFISS